MSKKGLFKKVTRFIEFTVHDFLDTINKHLFTLNFKL